MVFIGDGICERNVVGVIIGCFFLFNSIVLFVMYSDVIIEMIKDCMGVVNINVFCFVIFIKDGVVFMVGGIFIGFKEVVVWGMFFGINLNVIIIGGLFIGFMFKIFV